MNGAANIIPSVSRLNNDVYWEQKGEGSVRVYAGGTCDSHKLAHGFHVYQGSVAVHERVLQHGQSIED